MKRFGILLSMLALLLLVSGVFAQDMMTPSVTVEDQVSVDGTVTVAEVVTDGPGFIVIHSANAEGGIGPVVGYAEVNYGVSNNVKVAIDTSAATSSLFAMLHADTGEAGVYEFGMVEGADGPVVVDGAPVTPGFTAEIAHAYDQFVADGTITIANVVVSQDGFVVIHSDNAGAPGPVLGFAPVSAGSNSDVVVTLEGDVTDVVWPMLHVDTGEMGTYEFGTVEGADGPVRSSNGVAVFPITVGHPAMRVHDQIAMHSDSMMMDDMMAVSITAESVLSEGDGWLVIHSDNEGAPGPVLGQTAVAPGTNLDVVVELEGDVTPVVWPMLHVDTGEVGTYEFGTVDGADGPVRVNDAVLVYSVNIAPFISFEGSLEGTTLTVDSAGIDAQGWLVIHSDNEGAPGPVIGAAPIVHGVNHNIVIELSEAPAGQVFPMLHYDTEGMGVYEFGTVDGADGPVRVNEGVVVGPLYPMMGE